MKHKAYGNIMDDFKNSKLSNTEVIINNNVNNINNAKLKWWEHLVINLYKINIISNTKYIKFLKES